MKVIHSLAADTFSVGAFDSIASSYRKDLSGVVCSYAQSLSDVDFGLTIGIGPAHFTSRS